MFTDNRSVVCLQRKPHLSKREIRWTEFLADFHFSTHHIPGKENCADSLTRQGETTIEAEVCSLEFFLDVHPDYAEEISEGYPSDPELSHIIRRLSASKDDIFHDCCFWDEAKERLYLNESSPARLCMPKGPIRLKLLQENYDCVFSGHQGRDRTFWNLSRHFYWPGMGKSVKEFVKSCESCQRGKSGKLKVGLLQPLPIPERPWDSISMDFIVGLPRTDRNHDAIFTFVDRDQVVNQARSSDAPFIRLVPEHAPSFRPHSSDRSRRPLFSSDALRCASDWVFLFDLEDALIFPPEIAATLLLLLFAGTIFCEFLRFGKNRKIKYPQKFLPTHQACNIKSETGFPF